MKCSGAKRKKLIEDATPDQIRVLSEIASNIVKGNFSVPDKTVKKLHKHKLHIRELSKSKNSCKKKKKLLVQQGGFLPFLVTPVLSALGALAGRVIGSQLGL